MAGCPSFARGRRLWQLSSLGPQWNLVAALLRCPQGSVSLGFAPGWGLLAATGEACCRPAGSSTRFSCSCLPGGLMPGEHSPGFGMMGVLASELQHEGSVTSFNVSTVPSPGGDLTAGAPSLRSSYSGAVHGCCCGPGRPLGAGPVPAVGRGHLETGRLSKPVGSHSVQGAVAWAQRAGPAVRLCSPAGQLALHSSPSPPPELGRGREQAERWPDTVDPRRVPEPQSQRGLRLVVRGPWVCLAGHRGMASVKGVEPEGLGVKPSLIVTWGVSVAGDRKAHV